MAVAATSSRLAPFREYGPAEQVIQFATEDDGDRAQLLRARNGVADGPRGNGLSTDPDFPCEPGLADAAAIQFSTEALCEFHGVFPMTSENGRDGQGESSKNRQDQAEDDGVARRGAREGERYNVSNEWRAKAREAMEAMGLSQTALAQELRCSKQLISDMLRPKVPGKRGLSSSVLAQKVADRVGVPLPLVALTETMTAWHEIGKELLEGQDPESAAEILEAVRTQAHSILKLLDRSGKSPTKRKP
jgi:transcriptional regulator with XRE-family HTH domain